MSTSLVFQAQRARESFGVGRPRRVAALAPGYERTALRSGDHLSARSRRRRPVSIGRLLTLLRCSSAARASMPDRGNASERSTPARSHSPSTSDRSVFRPYRRRFSRKVRIAPGADAHIFCGSGSCFPVVRLQTSGWSIKRARGSGVEEERRYSSSIPVEPARQCPTKPDGCVCEDRQRPFAGKPHLKI